MTERNYGDECGDHGGDEGDCGLAAGWGTDFDSGKCRFHRGTSPDGSSHENNGNAETHGLTSDPQKYYQRQDDADQERIDDWAESWARRADYELPGYDTILHETAVTLHQIHAADEYIAEEGVIVDQVIASTESGQPIVSEDENPAFLLKSRAMKDVIRTLKEFGCLDDPDSQQAAATKTLAEVVDGE